MLQDLCLPVRKIMRSNSVYLEMTMRDVYQTLYNKNYIEIAPDTAWVRVADGKTVKDVSTNVCDWNVLE